MMLVFDTSVIIAIEKENKKVINEVAKLSDIYGGMPQTTFITCYEFLLGIKNRSPKNQAKAVEFLNNFNCLSATRKTAEILSEMRDKYDKRGININLADLIIASQTKENNMVLVTIDKTFKKIDDINKIIID